MVSLAPPGGEAEADQVTDAFELLLEQLAIRAGELNRRGAAAFQSGNHREAGQLADSVEAISQFQDKVKALQDEWQQAGAQPPANAAPAASAETSSEIADDATRRMEYLDITPAPAPTELDEVIEEPRSDSPNRSRVARGRLARGLSTTQNDYQRPILEILVELGGSGRAGAVLTLLEERMRHRLNEYDYAPINSNPNEPRWRNTAQWCRNIMAHRSGYLRADSAPGIWEISEPGRAYLRQLQQQ